MRDTIKTAMLVAAALVGAGVVGLALIGGWAPIGTAQIIDSDACERACDAQESVCTDACGTHTDPVECEGQCRDALEDCLRECR